MGWGAPKLFQANERRALLKAAKAEVDTAGPGSSACLGGLPGCNSGTLGSCPHTRWGAVASPLHQAKVGVLGHGASDGERRTGNKIKIIKNPMAQHGAARCSSDAVSAQSQHQRATRATTLFLHCGWGFQRTRGWRLSGPWQPSGRAFKPVKAPSIDDRTLGK